MIRGILGRAEENIVTEKFKDELEEEIVLEILQEGRGEREERGERDEWNRHVGWHRKEVMMDRKQQHQPQQLQPSRSRHRPRPMHDKGQDQNRDYSKGDARVKDKEELVVGPTRHINREKMQKNPLRKNRSREHALSQGLSREALSPHQPQGDSIGSAWLRGLSSVSVAVFLFSGFSILWCRIRRKSEAVPRPFLGGGVNGNRAPHRTWFLLVCLRQRIQAETKNPVLRRTSSTVWCEFLESMRDCPLLAMETDY